jgi:hypothetical protein
MFIFPNFKNITFSDTFSGNLNHFPSSLPDSPTQMFFIKIKIPSQSFLCFFLCFFLVGFGGGAGREEELQCNWTIFIPRFLKDDILTCVEKLEISFRVIIS